MNYLLEKAKEVLGFGLKRELGFWATFLIGIGSTVGASVFVLLGPGVALAGEYLPLSFAIGGVLALLVALMFAEIATAYPHSGASLEAIGEAFGKGWPFFIICWLIILGDIAYLALNALGFSLYLATFIPIAPVVLALAGILLVTILNLWNVESVGGVESLLTVLLLLFLLAMLVVSGANVNFAGTVSSFSITAVPWLATLSGTALVYTALIGYEDIVAVAGEVEDPGRKLPWALLATVVVATVVYAGLAFAVTSVLPASALSGDTTPLLDLAAAIGFPRWSVVAAALVAAGTTLIAGLLVASRKIFALSKQGFFRRTFTKLNTSQVPSRAIIVSALVCSLLIITGSVTFVAYAATSVFLVSIISVAAAALKLRSNRSLTDSIFGAFRKTFRMPLFPLIPIVVIILALLLLSQIETTALLVLLGWVVVGTLVYLIRTPRLERAVGDQADAVEETISDGKENAKESVEDGFNSAGDKLADTISGEEGGGADEVDES